jgi:hypothetical protein
LLNEGGSFEAPMTTTGKKIRAGLGVLFALFVLLVGALTPTIKPI